MIFLVIKFSFVQNIWIIIIVDIAIINTTVISSSLSLKFSTILSISPSAFNIEYHHNHRHHQQILHLYYHHYHYCNNNTFNRIAITIFIIPSSSPLSSSSSSSLLDNRLAPTTYQIDFTQYIQWSGFSRFNRRPAICTETSVDLLIPNHRHHLMHIII